LKQWWQAIPLWGVDVPVSALCWGVAIAAFFQITMLSVGPLLLLTAMVWVFVLFSRVRQALGSRQALYADYYRDCSVPMLLIGTGTLLAALWMLFFYVGQYVIHFAIVPLALLLMANMPLLRRISVFRLLCPSAAFVFACAVPAYCFSFFLHPLQMLLSPQLWCMICLFLLYNIERQRNRKTVNMPAACVTVCLLALFLSCCYLGLHAEEFQRGFYVTLAMGASCLHVLLRLRSKLSPDAWYAAGWGMMTLPALLGILIYVPETWGL